jgi:hypothetical protein
MAQLLGGFSDEALEAYKQALAEQAGTDFAEGDLYDFTTCIRPNGTAYGTGGRCRKGTEGESKSGEQPKVTATPGMAAKVKAAKEKLKADKAANGGKRPDRIQEERRLEQNRKQREMDQKVKANQEKQKKINSQVSLVTPQKQGQADLDRLNKYIKEEAPKFDNQRQAIRDGKAKADDPDVKKNLALRTRNVNEAIKQRDQLQKEVDKASATQSPKRPADNSPAAQQRRAAAAARARD